MSQGKGHSLQVSYLCPYIKLLCFSIALAGRLKYHIAAGVLFIFAPDGISKISARIPGKNRRVEKSGNDFIYSLLIDVCLGDKNITPALGDSFSLWDI